MEILQEFFVTASLALVLSFLVAKLVSMALASAGRPNACEGIVMEELQFGGRVAVRGLESETKVHELVEEEAPQEVEKFGGEPVLQAKEIVELPEKLSEENMDDSVAVKESSENRVGVESAAEDDFIAQEDPVAAKEGSEDRVAVEAVAKDDVVAQEDYVAVKESSENTQGLESVADDDAVAREDYVSVKESSEDRVSVESVMKDGVVAKEDPVAVKEILEHRGGGESAVVDDVVAQADPVAVEENLENRVGVQSAARNEVVEQSEETAGIVESELKERNDGKEVNLDSDEDDWEGIERTELENSFSAAAKFVLESSEDEEGRLAMGGVGSDVLMELYGLHKIATEGPCHEPQPMALKLSARAKWNAWQRLGQMSPELAMEQYIKLLSEKVPGWMESKFAGDISPESSEARLSGVNAPDLSRFSHHLPYYTDERTPYQKKGAEEGDQIGASNFQDKAKE